MSAHHILFYDYVENMAERRVPYREAHLKRIGAEREAAPLPSALRLGSGDAADSATPAPPSAPGHNRRIPQRAPSQPMRRPRPDHSVTV